VVHGENDRIVPVAEAKTLYERVGSNRKYIKIFTAEEGGAEHCQVDHRQQGIDYIGDWLLANMSHLPVRHARASRYKRRGLTRASINRRVDPEDGLPGQTR
ncbi:MAG: hypothetical protein ACJ8ES_23065, partial [Xanthobacteraceae bacterium]